MTYNEEAEIIVMGKVTDPGHDYMCNSCSEIFEVHYRRENKPPFIRCPVCRSGDTKKLLVAPATNIWWRNPLASSNAAEMAPKHLRKVTSRSRDGRRVK